ncbi:hypothetical protein ACHAXR_003882 [Thalassiosira sp. AJA248-18]
MLRSRSNRHQRPSESTDEQQGRRRSSGGPSSYGGYPGASSPIGIASGADDDYGGYNNAQQSKGGGGRSRFGFGGGSNKKAPSGSSSSGRAFSNRDVWDRRSMGGTIKGSGSPKQHQNSAGFVLISVSILLIVAMGGATLYYRKMNQRMEHELVAIGKRKHRLNRFHREESNIDDDEADNSNNNPTNDNNNNNDSNNDMPQIRPQDLVKIRVQKQELNGEKHKWTTRSKSLENEITSLQSQIDYLQNGELAAYETQIAAMQTSLKSEKESSVQYKKMFVETHKSGSSGIIVPGGPGHALVQRREIENMESLDDYEDYVQRREDALWDKIDLLVEKLGRESKREAVEWFGPGPHKIELEIEYPQYTLDVEPTDWPTVRGVFTMEMAPLDLMPIAVNLFMQQVHHKLWNGCSFVINAMHILQGGPHRYTEGGKYDANLDELVSKFENARLDKMPFQEYSDEYPHGQYTVGFAGRPGGPDFYINKIDNHVNHGPGGQSHHDLHEEADPCFAKLVGGMGIIAELNRIPVDYDRGAMLLHPVVIVDSRVISSRAAEEEKQKVENQPQNRENIDASVEVGSESQRGDQNDQGGVGGGGGGGGIVMPAMGPSPSV